MADRLRLGTFDTANRFVPSLDLNNADPVTSVGYAFVRDTLKFNPAAPQQTMARTERRWGGSRVVGETHDNGSIEAEWYVKGTGRDDTVTRAEALQAALTSEDPYRYIEFRPDGATRSVYFDVRGPGQPETLWRWLEWQATSPGLIHLRGVLPCAPLALGDHLDVYDDFSVDRIATGEWIAGTGALSDWSVTGGQLQVSATGTRAIINAKHGYPLQDTQETWKVTIGSGTAVSVRAAIKWLDSSNHVWVGFDGPGAVLRAGRTVGGTAASNSVGFALSAGATYYLRGRIEGNNVIAEAFTDPPTSFATPAATVSYPLASADALGAGVAGSRGLWTNGADMASVRFDDYASEPFTARKLDLPNRIDLRGVPGSAPAQTDLHITQQPSSAQAWAVLGWAAVTGEWNRIWNGGFENSTAGWSATSGTYINNGATLSTDQSIAHSGTYSAQIVTTAASANQGARFQLYGRFRKGVTYTGEIWVRSAAATDSVNLRIGFDNTDFSGTSQALTNGWQKITASWTPTADRYAVTFAIRTVAAVAISFRADDASVYEGTTPPTNNANTEGRGGRPPFGLIEAEANDTVDSSNFALTTDVTASGENIMRWATSGAGTAALAWYIDPSVIGPDDFTLNDLRIEFWARVSVSASHTSPKLVLAARSADGVSFGADRYTQEFGSAGKLLVKPSTGTAWRIVRLGTLNFVSDPTQAQRWKLVLTASVAGGSANLDVDYLFAVPSRRRLSAATGKPNNASYPKFVPSTSETVRVLRSDGRATIAKPGTPGFPGPALGGPVCELAPGNNALVALTSPVVPDDPTIDATADVFPQYTTIHAAVRPRYFLARGT